MQHPPFDNEKDTLYKEILSKRLKNYDKPPKPGHFIENITRMTISYCNNPLL